LIFDPKLIKSTAASKAYSFVKTDVARIWLEDMIGTENIVLAEGKVHQRTRKLFNPIFNLKNIKKMLPYFYQHTNELGQNFDRQLSEKNEIKLLTIDIIGTTVFDYDFNAVNGKSELYEAFQAYYPFLGLDIWTTSRFVFPFIKKLPLKSENDLKTAISFVKSTVLSVIKKKRDELKNGVGGRISLLLILLKEMEDKTTSVSDEELIKSGFTYVSLEPTQDIIVCHHN